MGMENWSLRKQFKMQKLIQELNHLTLELQSQNHELIYLLQKYTPKHCFMYQSVDERLSDTSQLSKMNQTPSTGHKGADATNFSRISSQTVKQSSKRPSQHSVKQSRVTQKMSTSKTRKQSSSVAKKRKNIVQEPMLLRLKKISQKQLGKLSGSVLLKKKSKIYHCNTQY